MYIYIYAYIYIIFTYICKQCNVRIRNSILGKLRMILDIDGTITSPTLKNLIGKSLACKNIFIDTLVVKFTGDSIMMYQLH